MGEWFLLLTVFFGTFAGVFHVSYMEDSWLVNFYSGVANDLISI